MNFALDSSERMMSHGSPNSKFLSNMKKRYLQRRYRELNYNLFSNDTTHGYLKKRKKLPNGKYSRFLEIDTKIPYFRKNRRVKSRYMESIGNRKKRNNTLDIMRDYEELKIERERKILKRKNERSLRSHLSQKTSQSRQYNRSIFELDSHRKENSILGLSYLSDSPLKKQIQEHSKWEDGHFQRMKSTKVKKYTKFTPNHAGVRIYDKFKDRIEAKATENRKRYRMNKLPYGRSGVKAKSVADKGKNKRKSNAKKRQSNVEVRQKDGHSVGKKVQFKTKIATSNHVKGGELPHSETQQNKIQLNRAESNVLRKVISKEEEKNKSSQYLKTPTMLFNHERGKITVSKASKKSQLGKGSKQSIETLHQEFDTIKIERDSLTDLDSNSFQSMSQLNTERSILHVNKNKVNNTSLERERKKVENAKDGKGDHIHIQDEKENTLKTQENVQQSTQEQEGEEIIDDFSDFEPDSDKDVIENPPTRIESKALIIPQKMQGEKPFQPHSVDSFGNENEKKSLHIEKEEVEENFLEQEFEDLEYDLPESDIHNNKEQKEANLQSASKVFTKRSDPSQLIINYEPTNARKNNVGTSFKSSKLDLKNDQEVSNGFITFDETDKELKLDDEGHKVKPESNFESKLKLIEKKEEEKQSKGHFQSFKGSGPSGNKFQMKLHLPKSNQKIGVLNTPVSKIQSKTPQFKKLTLPRTPKQPPKLKKAPPIKNEDIVLPISELQGKRTNQQKPKINDEDNLIYLPDDFENNSKEELNKELNLDFIPTKKTEKEELEVPFEFTEQTKSNLRESSKGMIDNLIKEISQKNSKDQFESDFGKSSQENSKPQLNSQIQAQENTEIDPFGDKIQKSKPQKVDIVDIVLDDIHPQNENELSIFNTKKSNVKEIDELWGDTKENSILNSAENKKKKESGFVYEKVQDGDDESDESREVNLADIQLDLSDEDF